MAFIHLLASLSCLILTQALFSMEPKPIHKKNLLSIFTPSDAGPHSSTKISPKSSPRKADNIEHNKISPRKHLEIVENNPKISPKVSPRFIKTMDNSDTIENIKHSP